jgi:UDP-GlcNAc:undecaprenyl-phosphate/decaprenyl-phosphate GlcNAc-1-phosphate transferase
VTNARWFFACALCGIVCFAAIVGFRSLAFRIGLVDVPGGRKRHGDSVPLLGGIAIILSTLCAVLAVPPAIWPNGFLRPLAAAIALVGVAGVLDDLHEISAKTKLVFQLASIVMLTSFADITLNDLGAIFIENTPISTGAWAVPFTLIAAIGLMNAVNMVDGLDGLLGCCALCTFGFLAYVAKQTPNSAAHFYVLSFLCIGLSIFLIFNFPYANRVFRTFLGDTGSLFIGLMICWFSVSLSQQPVRAAPPILFVWLCGLFLLDFLCITLQRLVRKRNPLRPDRRHWHHLLLRAGLSPRFSLLVLVAAHVLFCAIGLSMWKAGFSEQAMLFSALIVLALVIAFNFLAISWVPRLAKRLRLFKQF